MKMAEGQFDHRRRLESFVVKSQQDQAKRGQFFGLIIALVFLLCATYAALNGHPVFGTIIGSADIVGLVAVFVLARRVGENELAAKRGKMESQERTEADADESAQGLEE